MGGGGNTEQHWIMVRSTGQLYSTGTCALGSGPVDSGGHSGASQPQEEIILSIKT